MPLNCTGDASTADGNDAGADADASDDDDDDVAVAGDDGRNGACAVDKKRRSTI